MVLRCQIWFSSIHDTECFNGAGGFCPLQYDSVQEFLCVNLLVSIEREVFHPGSTHNATIQGILLEYPSVVGEIVPI